MIKRNISTSIADKIGTGKAIIVIGPRQVGKSGDDIGQLWENFLVSEGIKVNRYKLTLAKSYFRRTNQQHEIDYVEQKGLSLSAYAFKWNPKKKVSISKTFLNNYEAEGRVIHRCNFREFVFI